MSGKKKEREKDFKRISTKLYALFMLVMVCAFCVALYTQHVKRMAVEREAARLESVLAERRTRLAGYEQQLEQIYSDENIEKRARELNLVNDGDIVYIPRKR